MTEYTGPRWLTGAEAEADRANNAREVEQENEAIRRLYPDGVARVGGPRMCTDCGYIGDELGRCGCVTNVPSYLRYPPKASDKAKVGDAIEVSLPGEPPFRARVWKDTNSYTLWYETGDGAIDFAAREYIRVIDETK